MPFKSKSQARYMHAAAERGDIPQKTVSEWDEATKHKRGGFGKLPEKKMAFGGQADITSEGGRAVSPSSITSQGALERFMARRASMAHGGDVHVHHHYSDGGAIEPIWEPLDEQDEELLDEEPEDERHRKELMLAFAGALAQHRRK